MSGEELRQAAAKIRNRAETLGPDVALAVADWLVGIEYRVARGEAVHENDLAHAERIARVHLGSADPPAPASPDLGTGDGEAG